mgnify:CR=1 FL=1
MVWSPDRHSSHQELGKIYPFVVPYTRGTGLDIGSGQARWFKHWITLDSGKDFQNKRVADIHLDGSGPLPFKDGAYDFVVSSHFLEHIKEWPKALAEWWRVIRTGGHLVLYWPHPELYPRVGQPGANPDHKADIWPVEVVKAMRQNGGWDLLEDETRAEGEEYSQFQVWRKREDRQQNVVPWRRIEKSVLVVRYGAYGDLIQASSVCAGLKAQGYHVTLNTTEKGKSVVEHDDNIDAFILQDEDQVPNESLGPYWKEWAKRFDRVVNLCESAEGALLTLPHSLHDWHSEGARKKLYSQNYLERQHDIADLPHDFKPRFVPTQAEVENVEKMIADIPGKKVLWILGGSSVHKVWPHMPAAIVRLLYSDPEVRVITAGEAKHRDIEEAIQNAAKLFFGDASRIIRTAGLWPIRGTMTLAQKVDVVVGPETGVLNAVSHVERPAKVVFLSHSSKENLTKHWLTTTSLEPVEGSTACYPCHRLHYDFSRCNQDKATGMALCQANTPVEAAVAAILGALPRTQMTIAGGAGGGGGSCGEIVAVGGFGGSSVAAE